MTRSRKTHLMDPAGGTMCGGGIHDPLVTRIPSKATCSRCQKKSAADYGSGLPFEFGHGQDMIGTSREGWRDFLIALQPADIENLLSAIAVIAFHRLSWSDTIKKDEEKT